MGEIIETMMANVKTKDKRVSIYYEIIQSFESFDCDTLQECEGTDPAFDQALLELAHKDDR